RGVLTEGTHKPMEDRKSPNIDLEVISLEGHLLPGHSGAPILNKNNEVIGIANGGLKDGSAGVCWAVPYNKIKFVSKSLKEQELASLPIKESELFSFTSVLQISRSKTLMLQQLRSGEMMDWYATQEYAERMNREALKGYRDWRVPAKGELQKIAQLIKKVPNSYTDTNELYWSSEGIVSQARAVHLGSGQEEIKSKRSKFSVWLVRNFD
ncbi:MAG: DUF1566 domain-containing protein, partial [Candidatus Electrothrix sp. AS4_5]|nr:DUF1566 domain-containing protein [Candidatus Electrothrix gigas]